MPGCGVLSSNQSGGAVDRAG